jgi:predicted nicotinamide N-methyase
VYPLQLVTLNNGLSLYVPDPAVIQSAHQNLLAEKSNTIFPYWAKIWASAHAMTLFLQEEPRWIQNKIVLEIGAGIGIPSLSIAAQTQKIIISDYAPDAVALLQKNIEYLNLNNAQAISLNWNNIAQDIIADTILLSDTNYEPAAHNNLVLLIDKCINKGSTILLATPNRIASNPFIERISRYIDSTKNYSIHENDTTKEIIVLVLKK